MPECYVIKKQCETKIYNWVQTSTTKFREAR